MTRALVVLIALVTACGVPKRAGFDDVEKLVGDRTSARVHWNQGSEEDARVAQHVDALLGGALDATAATEIALLNNPRLQATYERLGVAQADVMQAGLLRNPSFGAHVGLPIASGLIELNASIVGEFLDLFLIPLKKKFANAEFRRVKREVADEVLALAGEVRDAFFTAQASVQIVALRRVMLDAEQAAAELALRLHAAGNLSDLDLTVQQGVYAESRLELARAEAQLQRDRERVSRLLGVWGLRTEWKLGPTLPELPPGEPALEHLESFAVAHRLDLDAAREEVLTASAALQITKGSRVIGGLEAGADGHRDPDGPTTIGPSLRIELPIFDQKQAAIARLRSQLRAAERRQDALAIEIRSQVRESRARVLAARGAVEFYRAHIVPLRERQLVLAQQQYNAMLLGVYQVLAAKQAEVAAYREYIEAVRDYWIARSDLERAIGARLPPGGP